MAKGLKLFIFLKDLDIDPVSFDLQATPAELETLRQRLKLVDLADFVASGTATPISGGSAVRIDGRISALATQNCVVTLEPVQQRVNDAFTLNFGETADLIDAATGELVVVSDDDQMDPLPDDAFDMGELVSEQLALAIDPYPRKEGADLETVLRQIGIEPDGGKVSPFAALAALKTKA